MHRPASLLLQDQDRSAGAGGFGQGEEAADAKPAGAGDQDGREQPDERQVVLEAGGGERAVARGTAAYRRSVSNIGISSFEFVSDFEIRIWPPCSRPGPCGTRVE
jgi:hypothetical protein